MSQQEELSPTEKLTKQLIAVLSQYRSEQMSQAVKRGMLHRVANGYAISRPPLGYSTTDIPGLFKVNHLGYAMSKMLKKVAKREINVESVTFSFALLFYSYSTGVKLWSTTKTKRLVSDPYYAGYISHSGQLYLGQHEPLITKEEHDMILDLLQDNSLEPFDKNIQSN